MAITVPRPNLNWRERMFLPAIAAGLLITLKHFKNMIFRRTKVTMQYPEEKWDSNLPSIIAARLRSCGAPTVASGVLPGSYANSFGRPVRSKLFQAKFQRATVY